MHVQIHMYIHMHACISVYITYALIINYTTAVFKVFLSTCIKTSVTFVRWSNGSELTKLLWDQYVAPSEGGSKSKSKSKIFHYNTRKMYIDESIRLKPIRAYLSFISIFSLYNNYLHFVEQVSKSARTQQTRHTVKRNHCYVKNSVLSPSRRNNEIAPAQRVFCENNGVSLYNNMYIAEDEQSLHIIITSAMIIYHTQCWTIQHHIVTVIFYLVDDFLNFVEKDVYSWYFLYTQVMYSIHLLQ